MFIMLKFINFTQRYKKINIAMHILLTFKATSKKLETLSREIAVSCIPVNYGLEKAFLCSIIKLKASKQA